MGDGAMAGISGEENSRGVAAHMKELGAQSHRCVSMKLRDEVSESIHLPVLEKAGIKGCASVRSMARGPIS